jgi:hypothetical protein
MRTITTYCHKCWSSTTHPLEGDDLSRYKIRKYLDDMIALYERMHERGLTTQNEIADAAVQLGKVHALKEFRAHLQGGSFNEY